jgi:hypothetical protein
MQKTNSLFCTTFCNKDCKGFSFVRKEHKSFILVSRHLMQRLQSHTPPPSFNYFSKGKCESKIQESVARLVCNASKEFLITCPLKINIKPEESKCEQQLPRVLFKGVRFKGFVKSSRGGSCKCVSLVFAEIGGNMTCKVLSMATVNPSTQIARHFWVTH